MGSAFLDLVPFIIGAGVVPVHAILVLMLLRGAGGVPGAIAFVSGAILVRLTQGVVFGLMLSSASEDGTDEKSGTIKATFLVVLGLLLLITAFRKIRKEDDPDAPPPKWLTMIATVGPLKAFGFGAVSIAIAAKQWVFTLGAIGAIRESGVTRNEGVTIFIVFTLLASLLLTAPIIYRILAPGQSERVLARAGDWLERNNATIVIVVSVVFGLFFLYQGVSTLTS